MNSSYLRRHLFFGLNRLIGSRCGAEYRELEAWERLEPEVFRRRRDERLRQTLEHAAAHVPYYRARVASGGRTPALADFPLLTRPVLRAHYPALMSEPLRAEYEGRVRRAPYAWVETKTGGSTGTPTAVIHGPDFRDFDRAARLYAMRLCGFPFGTPYFRLWGSMADINRMRDSRAHRAMTCLAGERILNAFRMEPAQMDAYLETLNRSQVQYLMAYVDAAHALALHARRTGVYVHPLRAVMACAGTVTDAARAAIGEVFGGRVHNKYGSRDCGDMACECERGGLHIFGNRWLLEVVGPDDRPVPAGESGRVLVTVLGNLDFPLIRYEIGDVGALAGPEPCPCGRVWPRLARIEGRSLEFLVSTGGGYVSPVYVRHLIGVVHNPGCVERFQLIQETPWRFTLLLQLAAGTPGDTLVALRAPLVRDLGVVLGADAVLDIQQVANIPESASGKFLYCVNKCRGGVA